MYTTIMIQKAYKLKKCLNCDAKMKSLDIFCIENKENCVLLKWMKIVNSVN